jgi:hypothetical protein
MQFYRLTTVETLQETSEDIAWKNIVALDKCFDLQWMIGAVMAYLVMSKEHDIVKLAQRMHDSGLNTHLFADDEVLDGYKCVQTWKQPVRVVKYRMVVSARPREEALKEVKTTCNNWNENLQRLAQAGSLVSKNMTEFPTKKRYLLVNGKPATNEMDDVAECHLKCATKLVQPVDVNVDDLLNHPDAETVLHSVDNTGLPNVMVRFKSTGFVYRKAVFTINPIEQRIGVTRVM